MELIGTKKTKKRSLKDLKNIDSLEALFSSSSLISDYYGIENCVDSINLEVTPSDKLSNGDTITVNITYDNKLAKELKIKFTGKKVSEKVENLEAVTKIDPFEDIIVSFSGTSPYGYMDYYYEGDNQYINSLYFNIDHRDNLKNGDTVTLSLDASDENTLRRGYVFTTKEKQYVVEGLEEYIENYADLSSDFIENLKAEAVDTIYAYSANEYNKESSLSDLTYSGYIFNRVKSDSGYYNNHNEIYIIYSSIATHSEGKYSSSKVYFPVKFSNILKNGDNIYYTSNDNIFGKSYFDNSWSYYTKGYINPLICYQELVEANRENYVIECGDGFEDYAEQKTISSLNDLSKDFRDKLAEDTKDFIESYAAKDYSDDSHMKDLSLMGEYLLIVKNQGMDFVKNNKYILVYSATVYNDNDRFEPSTIYFPVEYDGIVKLPNEEYMITANIGMLGYTYIGNSSYRSKGYSDGVEMFKKLVTANRDLYTYEVSDGLKEFGE